MDRMINVYLFAGYHPIYESIIKFPPSNVRYISSISLKEFEVLKVYQPSYSFLRKIYDRFWTAFFPRMFYFPQECDIIHSSRGVMVLNKRPWVVDIEHIAYIKFVGYSHRIILKRILSSRYCKKILPHCIASFKSLMNLVPDLKNKMEVLYPAIKPFPIKKRNKGDKVRILFVGKDFYRKGGKELLRAFDILTKKYDGLELVMKTNPPVEILRKYENREDIKFITHLLPRNELFTNVYGNSDIFVMPTYVDSFGYVFLEAMSCSLPVIGTDIFAIPEIIEDGKNGFLIHSPISDFDENYLYRFNPRFDIGKKIIAEKEFPDIVNQLVDRLSLLIEDSSLRKRMGRCGRKLTERGKFSIIERNKKLFRIYEESLK